METVLTNFLEIQASLFYHNDKSDFSAYQLSNEFRNLKKVLKQYENSDTSILMDSLKNVFGDDSGLVDITNHSWGDRCYTFQVFKIVDREFYSVNICVSFLVPFYLAYSSHNKFGEEVIKDSGVFMVVDEVIQMEPFDNLYWDRLKLKEAMSDNFSITEFPGSLINKQFKESYWFGDNCKNKFTYFHAFFKNVMDVQK